MATRTYDRQIFVFGSNLAGRHGAGSALEAMRNHGAVYGKGRGLEGDSYAIPTKSMYMNTLPLNVIQFYVDDFLRYAKRNPHLEFNVVAIGCGLAGYKPEQIAPMFKGYPDNVNLPEVFLGVLSATQAS